MVPVAATASSGSASTSADASPRSGRAPADDVRGERQLAAAAALTGHRGRDLEDVAGAYRGRELDVGVGREEPFVAVGHDHQIGCDVAEEPQRVRTVDQVARVVRMRVRHVRRCVTLCPSLVGVSCVIGQLPSWSLAENASSLPVGLAQSR